MNKITFVLYILPFKQSLKKLTTGSLIASRHLRNAVGAGFVHFVAELVNFAYGLCIIQISQSPKLFLKPSFSGYAPLTRFPSVKHAGRFLGFLTVFKGCSSCNPKE